MTTNTASITDLRVMCREVERRCRDVGINVEYVENLSTPCAMRGKIQVPTLAHPVSELDLMYHRYRILHEVGHHNRDGIWDFADKCTHDPKSNVQFIWNVCEDEANERAAGARWFGDRKAMCLGRSIHLDAMLETFAKERAEHPGEDVNSDTIKHVAAYGVALLSRRDWHPGVEHLYEVLKGAIPEAAPLMDELVAEGWPERIGRGDVPGEYDTARDLHNRLWPEEEQPPTSEEVQQNELGKPEKKPGDKPPATEEPQHSEDGDKGEDEQEAGGFVVPWDKILPSTHDADTPKRIRISYDGWTMSGGEFWAKRDIDFRDLSLSEERTRHKHDIISGDKGLANQLRRHVQSVLRSAWETERSTGRINKRALKRVVMGTRDYHRRVFQRRTDAQQINTAISVLVDASGSMRGTPYEMACAAAGTLAESFGKALHIPVEVLNHTTGGACEPVVGLAKSFSEQLTSEEVQARLHRIRMSGNADGDALLLAAERLARRPEARKILILLADGEPTDAKAGDAASLMKIAIKEIKAMGIELHGIGLYHEGIRMFFENAEVIHDLSQVNRVLLKTAEKFVLKN